MDYLAAWGAGLSTLLAGVKLWEMWRNYFRVEAAYNLTSSVTVGNEIYIRNLNNRPIMLEHWVLEWRKGLWPFYKIETIFEAEDISEGRRIEAHDSMTIRFVDEYYFSTGKHLEEGKRLYIKLYFVGKRRPKIVKVY
ncbi:TPA: hypothetical protein ACSP3W_001559 [Aeromonas veronii]|uniref:hypothetical protein n=1 Tax=Aeromonas sobria TaxID=646 RepID=UPI0011DF95E7|nr:hypothetical protein [Aeromonas sobria]